MIVIVKGYNAIPLWVRYFVSKDHTTIWVGAGTQRIIERCAVEDVIAQDERHLVVTNKFLTNDKCLRQAIGAGLNGILQIDTPLRTITKQALEACLISWGRDDEDVANPCLHQRGERVVDHWLVINRHQLFANCLSNWPQARARATCQNNTFHT